MTPKENEPEKDDLILQFPPPMPLYYHFKGVFMALVFLITSSLGTVLFHFPFILFLKPFSYNLWLVYSRWIASLWYFRLCSNLKEIVFTGDKMRESDFALLLSNHPSEADWLYFFGLANRMHRLERLRIVLKAMMRLAPGAGWAMENLQFLFLERAWEADGPQIRHMAEEWKREGRVIVGLFPEGTDFSLAKRHKSHLWAQGNHAPQFSRLLTPRVKGLAAAREALGTALTAVYDLTVAYERPIRDGSEPTRLITPTLWSAWCGWCPSRVSLHLRRFDAAEVPMDEENLTQWTWDRWEEKEHLLKNFEVTGTFPGSSHEWIPAKGVWGPFLVWIPLTVLLIYAFFAFPFFRYLQYVGWLFFGLTQWSSRFRVWRGIQPSISSSKK